MSPSEQLMRAELDSLPDLALAVEDPRTAEQVLLVIAVLTAIWEQHAPDAKSRCLQCRTTGSRWLWRKRQACNVRTIFDRYRLAAPRRGSRHDEGTAMPWGEGTPTKINLA